MTDHTTLPDRRRNRDSLAAQLYVHRPDGQMLLQGVDRVEDIEHWIHQLVPLIPTDATWEVLGPKEYR